MCHGQATNLFSTGPCLIINLTGRPLNSQVPVELLTVPTIACSTRLAVIWPGDFACFMLGYSGCGYAGRRLKLRMCMFARWVTFQIEGSRGYRIGAARDTIRRG